METNIIQILPGDRLAHHGLIDVVTPGCMVLWLSTFPLIGCEVVLVLLLDLEDERDTEGKVSTGSRLAVSVPVAACRPTWILLVVQAMVYSNCT